MSHKSRIPELDGVRGMAILLVLLAHMGAGAAPANRLMFSWWNGGGGGLVGVQLFFVLSGYLITGILLRERATTGAISFKAFYLRRIRRLVPALVLICLAVAVAEPLVTHKLIGAAMDVLLALTYTTNIAGLIRTIHGVHVHSTWLGHTWSLAVEEQFYLLWPATLVFVARRWRNGVVTAALGVAAATILARFVLPMSAGNMYRLMRWDALLFGCALAAHEIKVARWIGWLGWLAILWYAFWPARDITALDLTATSLACAAALATAKHEPCSGIACCSGSA